MTRVVRAVSAAAAVCALAGCGVRPTGVVSAGEAPTATATSLPKAQVYFYRDGALEPVERSVPPWDTQAVFDALLAGPTAQERERGLRTELTSDVTVRAIGTRTIFVESRRRMSQRGTDGYVQISCTARLLPGAPIVRAPDGLDAGIFLKLSSAGGCPTGDDPLGVQSGDPTGTPSPSDFPDIGSTDTSPTGEPGNSVPEKVRPSADGGPVTVPKPTG